MESDFAQFTLADRQNADAGTLHKIYRHLYWKLIENPLKTRRQTNFRSVDLSGMGTTLDDFSILVTYTPAQSSKPQGNVAMDWKLIFQLSLFGLAMGIATVFLIPPNVEPVVWLIIFLVCAYIIARRRPTGRFAHGLLLGLANAVWITAAHALLFDRYVAGHPQEAAMMKSMPLSNAPRLMTVILGPVVGLISGIIIGLLALAAGKITKSPLASSVKTTA